TSAIGRKHQLGAVHQLLAPVAAAGRVGCAFAQRPAYQGESKTLGFDGIHEAAPKTVTQPCRERLSVGINPQARPIERSSILGQEIVLRRQLEQNGSTGGDRKAGITTLKRVANA